VSRARFCAQDPASRPGFAMPILCLRFLLLTAVAAAVGWGGAASAGTIDFDDVSFQHGTVIEPNQFAPLGVTITVDNFSGPDLGVIFDTNFGGATTDPDLVDPDHVNFPEDEDLGFALIIQENSKGCGDGVCNDPDDEGSRPAGKITLEFDIPLLSFGFDLIDVEPAASEDGRVSFFLEGALIDSIRWDEIECAVGPHCDPSVSFGDDKANRIDPFTAAKLGSEFDKVVIKLGGSGAIDTLQFTEVPEPSALWLLAGGVAALGAARRRRA
jgi:hypothetical protein